MLNFLQSLGATLSIGPELLAFFWRRKRWWLIPIVVLLLFMGFVLILGSTTGLGPFIYPLF